MKAKPQPASTRLGSDSRRKRYGAPCGDNRPRGSTHKNGCAATGGNMAEPVSLSGIHRFFSTPQTAPSLLAAPRPHPPRRKPGSVPAAGRHWATTKWSAGHRRAAQREFSAAASQALAATAQTLAENARRPVRSTPAARAPRPPRWLPGAASARALAENPETWDIKQRRGVGFRAGLHRPIRARAG
jgi:hypothetical protein